MDIFNMHMIMHGAYMWQQMCGTHPFHLSATSCSTCLCQFSCKTSNVKKSNSWTMDGVLKYAHDSVNI